MKRLPEPTTADVKAWKRLTREAHKAAAMPAGSVGDLSAAEKPARKARVLGVYDRENACLRLIWATRAYCQTAPFDRAGLAVGLEALAAEVDGLIAQASAPKDPPPRRHRADVDG